MVQVPLAASSPSHKPGQAKTALSCTICALVALMRRCDFGTHSLWLFGKPENCTKNFAFWSSVFSMILAAYQNPPLSLACTLAPTSYALGPRIALI